MSNESSVLEMSEVERFVAERVHVAAHTALSLYPGLAGNVTVKAMLDASAQQMVLLMKSWCLCGIIPSTTSSETVEWPDGVWQMFKYRYMPHWFTERFPVVMTGRSIINHTMHYFVCPHLPTDRTDRHVQFMATGTPLAAKIRNDR